MSRPLSIPTRGLRSPVSRLEELYRSRFDRYVAVGGVMVGNDAVDLAQDAFALALVGLVV